MLFDLRHRCRSEAQTARDHRFLRVERNGVFVCRDTRLTEEFLGGFSGDALRAKVDEHQVVVRSAGDDSKTAIGELFREGGGILHDAFRVVREGWLRREFETGRLACDGGEQGTSLYAGKYDAVELLRIFLAAEDEGAARSSQRLVWISESLFI